MCDRNTDTRDKLHYTNNWKTDTHDKLHETDTHDKLHETDTHDSTWERPTFDAVVRCPKMDLEIDGAGSGPLEGAVVDLDLALLAPWAEVIHLRKNIQWATDVEALLLHTTTYKHTGIALQQS